MRKLPAEARSGSRRPWGHLRALVLLAALAATPVESAGTAVQTISIGWPERWFDGGGTSCKWESAEALHTYFSVRTVDSLSGPQTAAELGVWVKPEGRDLAAVPAWRQFEGTRRSDGTELTWMGDVECSPQLGKLLVFIGAAWRTGLSVKVVEIEIPSEILSPSQADGAIRRRGVRGAHLGKGRVIASHLQRVPTRGTRIRGLRAAQSNGGWIVELLHTDPRDNVDALEFSFGSSRLKRVRPPIRPFDERQLASFSCGARGGRQTQLIVMSRAVLPEGDGGRTAWERPSSWTIEVVGEGGQTRPVWQGFGYSASIGSSGGGGYSLACDEATGSVYIVSTTGDHRGWSIAVYSLDLKPRSSPAPGWQDWLQGRAPLPDPREPTARLEGIFTKGARCVSPCLGCSYKPTIEADQAGFQIRFRECKPGVGGVVARFDRASGLLERVCEPAPPEPCTCKEDPFS